MNEHAFLQMYFNNSSQVPTTPTCRGTSCAVAEVGTFIKVPGFGTTEPLLTIPLAPVGQ